MQYKLMKSTTSLITLILLSIYSVISQQLDNQNTNVFHFVHVSDIHISKNDVTRIEDLNRLIELIRNSIKPSLVLVTGDICDSRGIIFLWPKPHELEYMAYNRSIHSFSKDFWLDVPGNHDAFNHLPRRSPNNLFNKYSKRGYEYINKPWKKTYKYIHQTAFGKYRFIGIDTTRDPTPLNPYSFFGRLDEFAMDELEASLTEDANINQTILFAHHPYCTIHADKTSSGDGFLRLLKKNKVIAYMTGHLHGFGGLLSYLKSKFAGGHLEIPVRELRDYGSFRIAAMDNDIFSFEDTLLNQKGPYVLITNPKDCKFLSDFEPWRLMKTSTHIRMLVFPQQGQLKNLKVTIDGEILKTEFQNITQFLYAVPWNASKYESGVHTIIVEASDDSGVSTYVKQFSLDGARPSYEAHEIKANLLLRTNLPIWSFVFFGLLFGFIILSLLSCKGYYLYLKKKNLSCEEGRWFYRWFIRRYIRLAADTLVFNVLIVMGVMITVTMMLWSMFLSGIPFLIASYLVFIFYFSLAAQPTEEIEVEPEGFLEKKPWITKACPLIYSVLVHALFVCYLILRIIDDCYFLSFYPFKSWFMPPCVSIYYWIVFVIVLGRWIYKLTLWGIDKYRRRQYDKLELNELHETYV